MQATDTLQGLNFELSEEQLAAAVGEADENYGRFVGENVQSGEVLWGLFSMAALARSPQFQQAAA